MQGRTLGARIAVLRESIRESLIKWCTLIYAFCHTIICFERTAIISQARENPCHKHLSLKQWSLWIKLFKMCKPNVKKSMLQEVGCRGPYSFRKLPFYDRFLSTPVEPMHLIKNISEHVTGYEKRDNIVNFPIFHFKTFISLEP